MSNFWKVLTELCEKNSTSPTRVAVECGLANSAPVKWKNGSVPHSKSLKRIADYFDVSPDFLLGYKNENGAVKVKIYGTIAAGIPIDAIEDVIDEEEIPAAMANGSEYIGLKVKGDSMEPLIPNGAYAILRCQPDCENGQIAAVLINGNEATLKRVVKRSNGITLIPENAKYPTLSFSNEEIEKAPVTIIGVLKETRMKF